MGTAYEVVCSGRDRMEWLRERQSGIGGSDAAAVMGISKYGSPLSVYADKIEPPDEITDVPPSEFARWGNILEPHILAEFRRIYPKRRITHDGRLMRSRPRPFQMCTLDGRQRKPLHSGGHGSIGLVEIKTTMFAWERIPPDLWCQVQHQFAVTGFEWGSFVVWNRTTCEFTDIEVEPDREYIEELNDGEREFWEQISRGEPPATNGTDACAKALARLYPEQEPGTSVDLGPEFIDYAAEIADCKATAKTAESRRRELELLIKEAIADREIGSLPDGSSYTLRQQTRKESISKAATFRVLRRREVKG